MAVDISESEAIEAGFDLRVKNYRILEGMGVTFHCKMSGYPLPKVKYNNWSYLHAIIKTQIAYNIAILSKFYWHMHDIICRLHGTKMASASDMERDTIWTSCRMAELVCAFLLFFQKMKASILPLRAILKEMLFAQGNCMWSLPRHLVLRLTYPHQSQWAESGKTHDNSSWLVFKFFKTQNISVANCYCGMGGGRELKAEVAQKFTISSTGDCLVFISCPNGRLAKHFYCVAYYLFCHAIANVMKTIKVYLTPVLSLIYTTPLQCVDYYSYLGALNPHAPMKIALVHPAWMVVLALEIQSKPIWL